MHTPHALPEAVLAEQGAFLTRLSRSLLRDSHGAEDLVQDTWVRALEAGSTRTGLAAPSERFGGRISPWLGRVMRNQAISRFRRAAARGEALDLAAPSAPGSPAIEVESAAETAAQLESQRVVQRALTKLSEPRRSTLMLRFHSGLRVPEIAERMDAPVPTVKSRLASGLKEMRASLDAEYGGGEDGRSAWGALILPIAGRRLPEDAAAAGAKAAMGGAWTPGAAAIGGIAIALAGAVAFAAAFPWRGSAGTIGLDASPGSSPSMAAGDSIAAGATVHGASEVFMVPTEAMAREVAPGARAPLRAEVRTGALDLEPGSGPFVVLQGPGGQALSNFTVGTSYGEPHRARDDQNDGGLVTDAKGRAWLPARHDGMPKAAWKPLHVFPVAPLLTLSTTVVGAEASGATTVTVPPTAPLEVRLSDSRGAPWAGPGQVWIRAQGKEEANRRMPHQLGAAEALRWPHVGRGVPYEIFVRGLGEWNDVHAFFPAIGGGEPGRVHDIQITSRRVVLVGRLVDPRGAALPGVSVHSELGGARSGDDGRIRLPMVGNASELRGTDQDLRATVGAHWGADAKVRIPEDAEPGDVGVGNITVVERQVTVMGRLVTEDGIALGHRDLRVVMRHGGGPWRNSGVPLMSAEDGSYRLTREVGDGTEELAIEMDPETTLGVRYVLNGRVPFERGGRNVEVRMSRE